MLHNATLLDQSQTSSVDFDEQINLLELEGNRLLAAANGLSEFLYTSTSSGRKTVPITDVGNSFTPACSRLAEISDGQRTVDEIRYSAESRLKDAENEILDLGSKLQGAVMISEKQKAHFRATVEDLRSQLFVTNVSKDAVRRANEFEFTERDAFVSKLRNKIEHLESANKSQEKTLLELNEQLEVRQREYRLVESTLNQIRGQLLDQEHKRGVMFFTGGSSASASKHVSALDQDIPTLVRSIERCIQELDLDVEIKKEKLNELTDEIKINKENFAEKEQDIRNQFGEEISRLKNELTNINEVNSSITKRAVCSEEQLARLKGEYERHIKVQSESVNETEERIKMILKERDCERKLSSQNKASLEKALEEAYRELVEVRTDRDVKVYEAAAVGSRLVDLQNALSALRTELEGKVEEVRELKNRELDLLGRESANEVAQKKYEAALEEVRSTLESVNLQHEAHIRDLVSRAKREGEYNALSRIEALSTQVIALTEKCHRLTLDLELNRSQHGTLQERYAELQLAHETTCHQLSDVTRSRDQLIPILVDHSADLNRLIRDAGGSVCELASLKSQNEKLIAQLGECERNFLSLKEQNVQLAMNSESIKQREEMQEKDGMECQLKKVSSELERLKAEEVIILRQLKAVDDHAKKLEESEKRLVEDLKEKSSGLETAERINASLTIELRENKRELSIMKEQVVNLQRLLQQRQGSLGEELNLVTQKLQDVEKELELSRKALKIQQETDEKAVEVAAKLQKEVTEKRNEIDTLCSKVHWLEDSLNTASKEKKVLEENNERLQNGISNLMEQKEKLSLDCRHFIAKYTHLQSQLRHAVAAHEKASLEQAAAKSQAEQFSQEVTHLRFKHQLELKELERTGKIIRLQHAPLQNTNNGNSIPPAKHAFSQPTISTSYISSAATNTSIPSVEDSALVCGEHPTSIESLMMTQPTQCDNPAIGSELQQLLQEMRLVLQVSKAPPTADSSAQTTSSQTTNSPRRWRYNIDQEITELLKTSNLEACEHSASHLPDMDDWSRDLPVRDTRSSDVYELITGKTDAFQFDYNGSKGDVMTAKGRRPRRSSANRVAKRQQVKSNAVLFDTETKAICERLEKKIENLSRFGENLQRDNLELEKNVKDHSKSLSRVRKRLQK